MSGKGKKRIAVCGFAIAVVLLVFIYLFMNPIILKEGVFAKEIHTEFKEKFNIRDHIAFVFAGDASKVKAVGTVDTDKLGDYKIKMKYGRVSRDIVVKVLDTKAPKVVASDYTTDMVEDVAPGSFNVKVTDAAPPEKIKIKMKKPEPMKTKGEFSVKIIAEDPSGNVGTTQVKLTRKKDKTPPIIEVGAPLNLAVGQVINDSLALSGTKVTDDFDKTVKISYDVDGVNVSEPNTYKIIYKAKDRSGNEAEVEREVRVSNTISDNQKVVYLTFDDGPSHNTAKILDILSTYNIKGTFFVTGNDASYRYLIQRAAKEGHTIGLHTYTHNYNIYTSEETFFRDLDMVHDMVLNLTGIDSHHIRFAGGSSNTVSAAYNSGIMSRLVKDVQSRGFRYYDWNVSSGDASGNTVPVERLLRGATGYNYNHICILMHDSSAKTTTVEALPGIIEYYKKKGYAFLPISDSTPMFHHGVNN
ncbi:MAG: polysaccharide deacetylase [Clostridiales bacterium]|nr:polysaccharide deacetylase [Clostridiales bacterium]